VFVTRDTVVIRDALCSENLFVNRIVHDPRRSWTEVWLHIFVICNCVPCVLLIRYNWNMRWWMHYRFISGKFNEHFSNCVWKKNISIDQSRSWETNICSTIQEIPCPLWHLKFIMLQKTATVPCHGKWSTNSYYLFFKITLITTPMAAKRYLHFRGFS